jgi:hypothetical protein
LVLGDEDGVVVVPRDQVETVIRFVGDRGNKRERAYRGADGRIPAREPQSLPYYKRCGAEEKLAVMKNIRWT